MSEGVRDTSTKGHRENMKSHRVVIEFGMDGKEVRRYDADLDYVAVMTVVEYYTGTVGLIVQLCHLPK